MFKLTAKLKTHRFLIILPGLPLHGLPAPFSYLHPLAASYLFVTIQMINLDANSVSMSTAYITIHPESRLFCGFGQTE